MQYVLMPNVAFFNGAFVLKRLSCEEETLLVWWVALLVLDHLLHVLDSVSIVKPTKGDCPSIQGLDEDLHVLYKGVWCGVHLPSKKTNSLGEAEESAEMHARRQEGSGSKCGVWHNRRTGSGRVCCVSSTETVSTQCHTRSEYSHQGVQSESVHSTLCVLILCGGHTICRLVIILSAKTSVLSCQIL